MQREAAAEAPKASIWKVIAASTVGTIIEWYDFFIYGTASALAFGRLFFPNFDPLVGTLAAFAAYAVGFFVRPFGGLLFGYLGDRYGRKPVLIMTLTLMGLSTAAIGLLPTYEQIGIAAPMLLLVLRMLQGLGAGAEYGGAILMVAEHAPERRGFFSSFPAAAVDAATLISAGIFALFSQLDDASFLAWGWRIPFLLSLVVLAVGLFIRRRIPETPEFTQIKTTRRTARVPLMELLRTAPRAVLVALGVNVALNMDYVFQVYALSYVTSHLGMSREVALIGVFLAGAIGGFACLGFGALSDRIGRRPVMMFGAIFTMAIAFPFFWLLDTKVPVLIWLAISLGHVIGMRSIFGAQPAFYTELFDPRVRYTGIAVARETTGALVGGPTPLVATALVAAAGGAPWPVALMIVAMAAVTAIAVWFAPAAERETELRQARASAVLAE
jgi:MFS family permease